MNAKAAATVYQKGVDAFRRGELRDANPYPDRRTARGCVTFSRAYRKEWDQGWRDAEAGRAEETKT